MVNSGVKKEYLKVAEGGVYLAPTLIQTVLGSCLGVAFHAQTRGMGAFFHAFLPRSSDFGRNLDLSPYRFVDTAIAAVMVRFEELGVKPGHLTVSLVGGADGLVVGAEGVGSQAGVGKRNVEAAYEVLERFRIRPRFADVGGKKGRRVTFLSSTGQLKIAKLRGFGDVHKPR